MLDIIKVADLESMVFKTFFFIILEGRCVAVRVVYDIDMLVFIKVVDLESRVFKTSFYYSSRSLTWS